MIQSENFIGKTDLKEWAALCLGVDPSRIRLDPFKYVAVNYPSARGFVVPARPNVVYFAVRCCCAGGVVKFFLDGCEIHQDKVFVNEFIMFDSMEMNGPRSVELFAYRASVI